MFYNEPAFLNREEHKTLKFKSSSDYSFSENTNSVPLTGIEFFEASRDMPVLFSQDEQGDFFPLALLSLMQYGHKQLNATGAWADSYIPAFVRRYPFALSAEGAVCFDKQATPCVSIVVASSSFPKLNRGWSVNNQWPAIQKS